MWTEFKYADTIDTTTTLYISYKRNNKFWFYTIVRRYNAAIKSDGLTCNEVTVSNDFINKNIYVC